MNSVSVGLRTMGAAHPSHTGLSVWKPGSECLPKAVEQPFCAFLEVEQVFPNNLGRARRSCTTIRNKVPIGYNGAPQIFFQNCPFDDQIAPI